MVYWVRWHIETPVVELWQVKVERCKPTKHHSRWTGRTVTHDKKKFRTVTLLKLVWSDGAAKGRLHGRPSRQHVSELAYSLKDAAKLVRSAYRQQRKYYEYMQRHNANRIGVLERNLSVARKYEQKFRESARKRDGRLPTLRRILAERAGVP